MYDPSAPDPVRRRLLQAPAFAAVAALGGCADDSVIVEDVAQLEPHRVARVVRPRSPDAVARALRDWPGPVSIGGGRYSQGGQIAAEGSLHLDMRGLNRLVRLDPVARVVRAQAGMTWRDLLDHLDPHDLSVAVMPSYSNFTLGGSVSVNCHGRYVGSGPIVNSVRALGLATASGEHIDLDRRSHPDLFAAVIGGYGGMGVVTEVELDLARNERLQRHVERVALEDYVETFHARVAGDPDAVLHNADLVPPDFAQPLAITWRRTQAALTVTGRLVPRDLDYRKQQGLIWTAFELPGGDRLLAYDQSAMLAATQPVVWRNHEASLDADSLEPPTRALSTYLLQEYFIPVAGFLAFARAFAAIVRRHDVNVLNVSIRHSPADTTTLLRWAPREVFSFVVYYKQRSNHYASSMAERWTRELIDAALDLGGRYYLPYRLHASRAQFARAYPEAVRYAQLKRRWDPQFRFRNALLDAYLPT
ncbi:MAG: FAD-binding oxidoreductase [Arenimonas sp.]